jgi:hypothetical protein
MRRRFNYVSCFFNNTKYKILILLFTQVKLSVQQLILFIKSVKAVTQIGEALK